MRNTRLNEAQIRFLIRTLLREGHPVSGPGVGGELNRIIDKMKADARFTPKDETLAGLIARLGALDHGSSGPGETSASNNIDPIDQIITAHGLTPAQAARVRAAISGHA